MWLGASLYEERAPGHPGPLTNVYHADLFPLLYSQLKRGLEHWPGPPAEKYLSRERPVRMPLIISQGCRQPWREGKLRSLWAQAQAVPTAVRVAPVTLR